MPVRMKQEKNNRVIDLNEKVCIIADYVGDYTGSGAQMFRPWQSDDLLAALSKVFSVRKNEKIGALKISNEGITCVFETVD